MLFIKTEKNGIDFDVTQSFSQYRARLFHRNTKSVFISIKGGLFLSTWVENSKESLSGCHSLFQVLVDVSNDCEDERGQASESYSIYTVLNLLSTN